MCGVYKMHALVILNGGRLNFSAIQISHDFSPQKRDEMGVIQGDNICRSRHTLVEGCFEKFPLFSRSGPYIIVPSEQMQILNFTAELGGVD